MSRSIAQLFGNIRKRTDDPSLEFFQEADCTFLTYRTGYRGWGIYGYKKDSSFALFSGGGIIWPKREEFRAKCLGKHLRAHPAPYSTCRCGIYAMNCAEDLKIPTEEFWQKTFIGEVKLWGTIFECTRGARAQFAYPLNIQEARCARCGQCKKLDECIFFPAYTSSKVSSIRALCKECEMSKSVTPLAKKLDPSFLDQVSEDYVIEIGERRC